MYICVYVSSGNSSLRDPGPSPMSGRQVGSTLHLHREAKKNAHLRDHLAHQPRSLKTSGPKDVPPKPCTPTHRTKRRDDTEVAESLKADRARQIFLEAHQDLHLTVTAPGMASNPRADSPFRWTVRCIRTCSIFRPLDPK